MTLNTSVSLAVHVDAKGRRIRLTSLRASVDSGNQASSSAAINHFLSMLRSSRNFSRTVQDYLVRAKHLCLTNRGKCGAARKDTTFEWHAHRQRKNDVEIDCGLSTSLSHFYDVDCWRTKHSQLCCWISGRSVIPITPFLFPCVPVLLLFLMVHLVWSNVSVSIRHSTLAHRGRFELRVTKL